jgi:two-component system response regulator RegA
MTKMKHNNKMIRLFIIDPDKNFSTRLKTELERGEFEIETFVNFKSAMLAISESAPDWIISELKLTDHTAFDVLSYIHNKKLQTKLIITTSYSSISTAVESIKKGAVNYFAKPVDANFIREAINNQGNIALESLPTKILSADRLKWEYIQNVYAICNFNISETARRLSMHRRTLQRILSKHAPQ